jgi:hypothetical protein
MSGTKTRPNTGDVSEYLSQVKEPEKRADSQSLVKMMEEVSGHPPVLWGTMVGFGQYHYRYASGREGDAFRIGFAPRKGDLSIYILAAYDGVDEARQTELLARLGKHKAGKSCLYVRKLADVDIGVLRALTELAYSHMRQRYPE